MSSIPSKAIPHAAPAAEAENEGGETLTLAKRVREQADRAAALIRDNPRTAIAAGAAVAAGVAAAAAIPLVKSRRAKANGAAKPARKAPARGKKAS
jgi:hypothetical protein